jgi:hypothetical protein
MIQAVGFQSLFLDGGARIPTENPLVADTNVPGRANWKPVFAGALSDDQAGARIRSSSAT